MTEYIDRETVKEIMQKYRCSDCTNDKSLDCPLCQLHRPFAEISKMPTADVVPRAEVDQLQAQIAQLQLDLHYSVCREDKKQSEVAREIIGEILSSHTLDIDGFFTMHESELIELKKKYTEESGNDR